MKTCIIAITLFALQGVAYGQDRSDPSHRFTVGLLGHYHVDNQRVGLSGHVKWLMPTHRPTANRFVFTAKATHTPPSNGPFFSAFDQGKYDNISTVYAMVGHRINLFDKGWNASASDPVSNNAAYLEINAGAGYDGHHRNFGVALNPLIGYSFNQRFELNMAYQGLIVKEGHPTLSYLEAGVGYRF